MAGSYTVRISKEADADIRGILDYTSKASPEWGKAIVDELFARITGLADMPGRFKQAAVSRRRKTPVHTMVVSPYVVYYRIGRDLTSVIILSVRHGRRRPPKRFQ